MELHEHLYALGLRLGREVFEDPETFRGALDDFLDEDSATTGDINLLVDAVRLGAFSSMTSMLGSGAQVTAAVEEAGNRLARDRGSADVAGAQWACAVLGFGIGKVSDAEVRRYRTQHATPQRSQQLPPTQFPGTHGQPGAAPTQRPGEPVYGGKPTAAGPMPTAQPYGQGGPGVMPVRPGTIPPPSSWQPGPPPAKKRKTWPIIVAAAAAVAVVAGGAVAFIASQGDDDPDGPSPGGEETEEVTGLPLDLAAVRGRHSGLADDVTAGVDECESVEAGEGISEVLECGFANGTLTLTTYETAADLKANRDATADLAAGSRFSKTPEGVIYSVDAASAVAEGTASSLYWDSSKALQSGMYVASSETVTLEQLEEQYDGIAGAVVYPTKPEDEGVIALAEAFVDLDDCDRIQTIVARELEESICSVPGKDIFVFVGQWKTLGDFRNYRREKLQVSAEQGHNDYRTWNFDGATVEGALADLILDDGTAVRYWDRPECKCYMEARLNTGDLEKLENWWVNA